MCTHLHTYITHQVYTPAYIYMSSCVHSAAITLNTLYVAFTRVAKRDDMRLLSPLTPKSIQKLCSLRPDPDYINTKYRIKFITKPQKHA